MANLIITEPFADAFGFQLQQLGMQEGGYKQDGEGHYDSPLGLMCLVTHSTNVMAPGGAERTLYSGTVEILTYTTKGGKLLRVDSNFPNIVPSIEIMEVDQRGNRTRWVESTLDTDKSKCEILEYRAGYDYLNCLVHVDGVNHKYHASDYIVRPKVPTDDRRITIDGFNSRIRTRVN